MNIQEKFLRDLHRQNSLVDQRKSIDQMIGSFSSAGAAGSQYTSAVSMVEDFERQVDRTLGRRAFDAVTALSDYERSMRSHLAVAYTNLVGVDAVSSREMASASSLIKAIEQFTSPRKSILGALALYDIPSPLQDLFDQLDVDDGLIGEFAYPKADSDDEISFSELAEPEDVERVRTRLVEVDFVPFRLFEAIRKEPTLMRGLPPRQFEELTADLLGRLGFVNIQLTPSSNDGGRDVVATKIINGLSVIMAFECKRYAESRKIGPGTLRALLGTINSRSTGASMGVLVTTSSFTTGANKFIAAEARIEGKDFSEISKWLLQANQIGPDR